MARANKKTKAAKKTTRTSESRVTVDRESSSSKRSSSDSNGNFLDKIQNDLEKNQSYLNLILGALIVVVLGVLIFNYFNRPADETGNVTPVAETTTDENGDVKKESLPGKYTVKEGDTLFTIAEKYFGDGYKYTEISQENELTGDSIEVGQELTIPKIESAMADASATPSGSMNPEMAMASVEPSASPSPEAMAESSPSTAPEAGTGTGGADNQTTWGETISGDSYTVQENDWLSKIAGRAYGDISKYQAIAQANNISNPDRIEVGTVLKLPRN